MSRGRGEGEIVDREEEGQGVEKGMKRESSGRR